MDWSWAIGGILAKVPRTSGPECSSYLSNDRRLIEGIIVAITCSFILKWTIQRLKPLNLQCYNYNIEPATNLGRRILLIMMTFIFGLEMGFKFSTRSVIFVLNPCHITTLIQIYLLAAKPSKTTTTLFRIQMNYLNGPLLAFLFPDADSRILPLETSTYWIQHGLLFIIPIYLIRHGDPYRMEEIMDFKWNIIGCAIMLLYHFIFLGAISVLTDVNLNHMLCPAVSDPFQGSNYRIAAIIHQSILCPILCKLFGILFINPNTKFHDLDIKIIYNNSNNSSNNGSNNEIIHELYNNQTNRCNDDTIMTTKID